MIPRIQWVGLSEERAQWRSCWWFDRRVWHCRLSIWRGCWHGWCLGLCMVWVEDDSATLGDTVIIERGPIHGFKCWYNIILPTPSTQLTPTYNGRTSLRFVCSSCPHSGTLQSRQILGTTPRNHDSQTSSIVASRRDAAWYTILTIWTAWSNSCSSATPVSHTLHINVTSHIARLQLRMLTENAGETKANSPLLGVGKSCLLLRFCDDSWTPSFITTIGKCFFVWTE